MDRLELASALDALVEEGTGRLVVVRGEYSSAAVAAWLEGVSGFDLVLRADVDAYRSEFRFRDPSRIPDMSALVADLIASISPDAVVPEELSDRVTLFRSLTADRRALLFLQNITDPAQAVLTYLGGRAGLNVVTSSFRCLRELQFDDAVFFEVSDR